jgi:hypothetical protein
MNVQSHIHFLLHDQVETTLDVDMSGKQDDHKVTVQLSLLDA